MKARWFVGLFTRDLKNKGLSLFFAVTIWYFAWNNQIVLSNRGDARVSVKVQPSRGEEIEHALVQVWTVRSGDAEVDFNHMVKLVLSGPQRDLRELDWDQVSAEIPVRPDECRVYEGSLVGQERLTNRHFKLPNRSLSVVEESIAPNVIFFRLSRIITQKVAVTPGEVSGSAPKPYRLSSKRGREVEPETMNVRGPECFFGTCSIVTEPTDITDVTPAKLPENLSYTFERRVVLGSAARDPTSLFLVDDAGRVQSREALRAKVTVYFEEEKPRKYRTEVKLWALVPPASPQRSAVAVKCDPPSMTVTFVGTEDEIRQVEESEKREPDLFGLYFVVEPSRKPGELFTKTLPDLRWDPRLIPPKVNLESAAGAGGVRGDSGMFRVEVLAVPGS